MKEINVTAREIAEYVQILDTMEYKEFLNVSYGITSSKFKNFANFVHLSLRHKMYTLSLNMILKGDY